MMKSHQNERTAPRRAAARKEFFSVSNAIHGSAQIRQIHGFAPPDRRLRIKAAAWWLAAFAAGFAVGAALTILVKEVLS